MLPGGPALVLWGALLQSCTGAAPPEAPQAPEAAAPSEPSEPLEVSDAPVAPASTGPPDLRPPLDGEPGVHWWISNRPDVVPGPGIGDHAGSKATYEGHDGTDFAVADRRRGRATPVRAPAAGRVLRARDGVPDGQLVAGDEAAIEGQECGNGLVVDVGGDWEVWLCHLAQGSVAVRAGERVAAGQEVGRVGLSGKTDHPHVHVRVRKGSVDVDPFSGRALGSPDALAPGPLWELPDPGAIDALAWAGFRAGPAGAGPDWPVDAGVSEITDSDELVLEVFLWRPRLGDRVETLIVAPDGTRSTGEVVQDRTRPRQVWRVSKPLGEGGRGTWRGEVRWRRGDRERVVETSVVVR